MPKVNILGVLIDDVDGKRLLQLIGRAIEEHRKSVFSYVNVHGINLAQHDARFRAFVGRAHHVYCDGEGVRLGARILGRPVPPKTVLTYWIWELGEWCAENGYSVFLLGSTAERAGRAAHRLKKSIRGLKVAGYHHGYFARHGTENERVVELINSTRPDVLLVGFGMPAQEFWIEENIDRLRVNAILPAGSAIDYAAGIWQTAPVWMRNIGLEWLVRLVQEPVRLAVRYLVGNPLFITRVLMQRVGLRGT